MRFLIDEPADGPTNMARDEALLVRVGERASPPTLRFYQWDPPTVSLGYFQKYAEFERLPSPAGDLAVVRRTTGGGAILHDREWTYSLTLPASHAVLAEHGPVCLYSIVHEALIEALAHADVDAKYCGTTDGSAAHRGPFFCFERRHRLDVMINGQKLAGSAQRRTKHAVLQHGSIVLENRFSQHPAAAIRTQCDDLPDVLAVAIGRRLDNPCELGAWSAEELELAEEIRDKYAGQAWTRKY